MVAQTRLLNGAELLAALRAKLDEELAEYDAAPTHDEALAELADALEVLYALAARRGWTASELEERRARKARDRGTFSQGIELISTD